MIKARKIVTNRAEKEKYHPGRQVESLVERRARARRGSGLWSRRLVYLQLGWDHRLGRYGRRRWCYDIQRRSRYRWRLRSGNTCLRRRDSGEDAGRAPSAARGIADGPDLPVVGRVVIQAHIALPGIGRDSVFLRPDYSGWAKSASADTSSSYEEAPVIAVH